MTSIFLLLLLCAHAIYVVDSNHLVTPKSPNYYVASGLGKGISAAALCGFTFANTVQARDLRESVASVSALLPGMGGADIFYPKEWTGAWNTRRNITSFDSFGAEVPDFLYNYQSGKRDYITIFTEHNGNIIRDRRLSSVSEAAAYSIDDPTSITAEWDVRNPNVLAVKYTDKGKSLIYQISKRSTEPAENGQKEVGYSEFGRIIESNMDDLRAPKVYSYRVLTRLRQINENRVLGLDRFYLYPPVALDARSGAADNKPIVVIKSQISHSRSK